MKKGNSVGNGKILFFSHTYIYVKKLKKDQLLQKLYK